MYSAQLKTDSTWLRKSEATLECGRKCRKSFYSIFTPFFLQPFTVLQNFWFVSTYFESYLVILRPDFSEYFNIGFYSILTCWFHFWPLFEPKMPGLPQKLIWNLEIFNKIDMQQFHKFFSSILVLKMEEKTCEIVSCQFC